MSQPNSTTREIRYCKEDHDYSAYLGGQYVGSFPTHHDAENALNTLALELVSYAAGWDAAAVAAEAIVGAAWSAGVLR
jgi:hypothetical protein